MNDRAITLDKILAEVASEFSVGLADLTGPGRRRSLVRARQAFYWLARHRTGSSWREIGEAICRGHSIVIRGADVFQADFDREAGLQVRIVRIESRLGLTS